jgi:uncharacterized protein (DUF1015 family)
VAAVPYDVVGVEEARALGTDPLSFLHVSRAEIDLPPGTDPYSDAVYARAAANFERLKREAAMTVDDDPGLYVYRLESGAHAQTGVAGCFSLDEYAAGTIRKHERTRRDKEDDRTRHTLAIRAQTGPVFLVHHATEAVRAAAAGVVDAGAPVVDFAAADGVRHTIWRARRRHQDELVAAFALLEALYIADGHHRAAAAWRVREGLSGAPDSEGADDFLGVAFPSDQARILPYNRVVKDLGRATTSALLDELRTLFHVEHGPAAPRQPGHVGMFLDGRWHTLALADAPRAAKAADRLDVSRLQQQVLGPLLGIDDARTDPRIDFVSGGRGTGVLEALVRSGRASVAFSMFPVRIDELMAVADEGGVMPPKSTWFEPKLRDGLFSHIIG